MGPGSHVTSQVFVTPAPKDLTPSPDLWESTGAHTCAHTPTHTTQMQLKQIFKSNKNQTGSGGACLQSQHP